MPRTLCFPPPVPARNRRYIQPVFLPFSGCPYRCAFCSQELQSGTKASPIPGMLETLEAELQKASNAGEEKREIAFYGGTFTALPLDAQLSCLEIAARYRKKGLVTRVRASTRPDCITHEGLAALFRHGLDMLELGVQSFDDAVLAASRPGYTGEEAEKACSLVRESGLALGVQLMPGLPGMNAEIFRKDILRMLSVQPETLRLYPCQVIRGTRLATMWQEGRYTPWQLDDTILLLAEALLLAETAGVAVIRIGLAPEPGFPEHILAGPSHPALGARVRGRALLERIRSHCAELEAPPSLLTLPRRLRGEVGGHRKELLPLYAELGLTRKNICWHDHEHCELTD